MTHAPTLDLDDSPVERSDLELVELTRSGNKDAFGDLWARHYRAAMRTARAISSSHDPEDLVQEAFMRIYQSILQGSGPKEVFRAYLYTVLKSVSMTWGRNGNHNSSLDDIPAQHEASYSFEGQVVADSITAHAFATLKADWRAVLWYLDVEEMKPAEAAPLLGLSANATSALAYRAREGLRSAWLQAHLNSDKAEEKCKWSVERLGAYNRGTLSARDKNKLQDHLVTCLKCAILVEEVDQISRNLGIFLLPALLGPATFPLLDSINQGTLTTAPIPPNPVVKVLAGSSKITLGVITSVVAASGLLAASFFILTPRTPTTELTAPESTLLVSPSTEQPSPVLTKAPTTDRPVTPGVPEAGALAAARDTPLSTVQKISSPRPLARVDSPVVTEPAQFPASASESTVTSPASSAGPSPTPTTEPSPTPSPTPTAGPSPTPTTEPSPTPSPTPSSSPTVLAEPSIDSVTEQGLYLPLLQGTGVPGATVTIVSSGVPLQSVVVGSVGSWSLVPDFTLTANMSVSFTAYQSLDGLVSETTTPTALVLVATPVIGEIQYANDTGNVSFSGPSGSTVEVLIDGISTGNMHAMDGSMIVRRLPSLTPGQHSLTLRFMDQASERHGAGLSTKFDVPVSRREAPMPRTAPV